MIGINATSLGLKDIDDFSFDFANTKNKAIYIDTIYNPLDTKTLKYLREEGRRYLMGLICLFIKVKNRFTYGIKLTQKSMTNVVLNSKLK